MFLTLDGCNPRTTSFCVQNFKLIITLVRVLFGFTPLFSRDFEVHVIKIIQNKKYFEYELITNSKKSRWAVGALIGIP